jgi:hypothetical protein
MPLIKKEYTINFEWFEYGLIIFFFILILLSSMDKTPKQEQYIPNAVTGLATVSSLLVASISFWLNRSIHEISQYPIKWMSIRLMVIGVAIVFGILILMLGLSQLVYGTLGNAYDAALWGTLIIIFTFLEVLGLALWRELQVSNQPET